MPLATTPKSNNVWETYGPATEEIYFSDVDQAVDQIISLDDNTSPVSYLCFQQVENEISQVTPPINTPMVFTQILPSPQSRNSDLRSSLLVDTTPILATPVIPLSPKTEHQILPVAHSTHHNVRTTDQATNLPSKKPRLRNRDYTADFKKEFVNLLDRHHVASVEWDLYYRQHKCSGGRPCMKTFLAFCATRSDEFAKLRREFAKRSPRLGTRTSCRCARQFPYR